MLNEIIVKQNFAVEAEGAMFKKKQEKGGNGIRC